MYRDREGALRAENEALRSKVELLEKQRHDLLNPKKPELSPMAVPPKIPITQRRWLRIAIIVIASIGFIFVNAMAVRDCALKNSQAIEMCKKDYPKARGHGLGPGGCDDPAWKYCNFYMKNGEGVWQKHSKQYYTWEAKEYKEKQKKKVEKDANPKSKM